MNNAEITTDQIMPALTTMSNHEYMLANEARRGGYSVVGNLVTNDERISFLTGSIDNVLTNGYRNAKTIRSLKGQARSLKAQTLVRYDTLMIPEVITKESVEQLMYKRELAKVSFERIQITEPNLIRQTQFNHVGYFTRSEASDVHVAVEGLVRILNDPADAFLDKDEVDEKLSEIASLYLQIRREEDDYVTSVMESIFDDPSKS